MSTASVSDSDSRAKAFRAKYHKYKIKYANASRMRGGAGSAAKAALQQEITGELANFDSKVAALKASQTTVPGSVTLLEGVVREVKVLLKKAPAYLVDDLIVVDALRGRVETVFRQRIRTDATGALQEHVRVAVGYAQDLVKATVEEGRDTPIGGGVADSATSAAPVVLDSATSDGALMSAAPDEPAKPVAKTKTKTKAPGKPKTKIKLKIPAVTSSGGEDATEV